MQQTGEVKKRAPARGPNLEPIQNYLEAQKKFLTGDRDEALKLVSSAVGSDKPLEKLEGSLGNVFDTGSPLSEMTSRLVLVESKRRNSNGET
jgi:hypothetical protein